MGARIQLCGRLAASVDDTLVERRLPGRQGRLLFAFLVLHRLRAVSRDELVDALWPEDAPPAADAALSALLSKLRRLVPLEGRGEVRLVLPDPAWVDVETAYASLHRAEAAAERSDSHDAWVAARIAQHIAVRPFLAGDETHWVEDVRRDLEGVYLRALEVAGSAALAIGGSEVRTAERSARALVRAAPYRESGYRLLMQTLAADGNTAEALRVYDVLRSRLREELGASPSRQTQDLHRSLLA